MKRSLQAVLALVVTLAGFGLATAPTGAAAPSRPKAFVATAAPGSSVWSQSVRLTATITPKGGGAPKGGTVTFRADGAPVGTATATTRGTSLTTSSLPPGTHLISADYSGDAVTAPSTSTTTATITVAAAPTATTLRATQDPVPDDQRAEIKATVAAVAPAAVSRRPAGSVTFSVDGCISGTVALNANGVATWRPFLCPGTRQVTAVYNGSERHATSSTATPLAITIEEPEDPDGADLDQENLASPSGLLGVLDTGEDSARYSQAFTAGRDGRTYAVDLFGTWISETDTAPTDLRITIQTLDAEGDPTGVVLGEGSLAASEVEQDVPAAFHVDLDTAADVVASGSYALVVEVSAPQTPEAFGVWILAGSGDDAYPAGDLHWDPLASGWAPYDPADVDLLFRTHVGAPV